MPRTSSTRCHINRGFTQLRRGKFVAMGFSLEDDGGAGSRGPRTPPPTLCLGQSRRMRIKAAENQCRLGCYALRALLPHETVKCVVAEREQSMVDQTSDPARVDPGSEVASKQSPTGAQISHPGVTTTAAPAFVSLDDRSL